jgi:hypothetical protein
MVLRVFLALLFCVFHIPIVAAQNKPEVKIEWPVRIGQLLYQQQQPRMTPSFFLHPRPSFAERWTIRPGEDIFGKKWDRDRFDFGLIMPGTSRWNSAQPRGQNPLKPDPSGIFQVRLEF